MIRQQIVLASCPGVVRCWLLRPEAKSRYGLSALGHARPGNDRPSASAGVRRWRWRLLLTGYSAPDGFGFTTWMQTTGAALAVRRRPDGVRKVLVSLAEQGSQHAAEMLAGWSLTGEPGRGITREAAEQSAWQAAAPFAEQAAERLASPPEGTPGSASMMVGFPADAGLVTILDPADIDQALTGLLRVAADHLNARGLRHLGVLAGGAVLLVLVTAGSSRSGAC
jgi:hypothetical protein